MSYDPTQQVPPPSPNYPPQQGYPPQPQQGYPPQPQGYAPQQGYPPPQGYPQSQPATPQPYAPYAGPPQPYGGSPAGGMNASAMWKALGTAGQICVIGGLILFLSLFMTWFSATLKCSGSDCNSSSDSTQTNTTDAQKDDRSASGFGLIFGGTSDLTTSDLSNNSVTENFGFFPLILVLLASIALMALPLMVARGKMVAKQGQTFILLSAGVALLIELVYMIAAFASFSKTKANVDDLNKFIQAFNLNATLSYATGPSFGFWIGFLATLAAGGAYVYFNYLKKPALTGAPAGVYAQPLQYPGSQPYQPPQYQGQPYGQPQYPGSQPYGQPPQYPPAQPYGQPPQYPNQPPPYPGQ